MSLIQFFQDFWKSFFVLDNGFPVLISSALFLVGFFSYLSYWSRRKFRVLSLFFSSNFIRDILAKKGVRRFQKSILKEVKELKDYKIFVLEDQRNLDLFVSDFSKKDKEFYPIFEKIAQEAMHHFVDVTDNKMIAALSKNARYKSWAYAYDIPFFNKRVLIFMYFSPYFISTPIFQDYLKSLNDSVYSICFLSNFAHGGTSLMSTIQDVCWDSPYAIAVCNPIGEVAFANAALYQMFHGSLPNFSKLIGEDIFTLLLDGKRIGQTLNLYGHRVQLEGYPLHNKNYLVMYSLLVFFDENVEMKRELLRETNTLRRFTSGNASIGAAMFTLEGVILYSNEAFMRKLDVYKIREANQKDIFELFHLSEKQFVHILDHILKGKEYRDNIRAVENDNEFSVLCKGVIFGDRTILEVVLQDEDTSMNNISHLEKETQELYEELRTAQSVQEHILTLPTIYTPGVFVETLYKPSRQLSGDFFTVIPFDHQSYMGFLIADVSGHGVSASLITAALKILIEFAPRDPNSLPKIIEYFNTYLADILPEGSFVTLFYGIVNFDDYSLQYINCGHPFPILQDLEKNETRILEGMGYPLGGLLNVSFDELVYTVPLSPKTKLFLYTDGLLQYLSGSIKDKLHKICNIIEKHKGFNHKELLEAIYQRLVFRHVLSAADDVSMMSVNLDRTRRTKHYCYISSTLLDLDRSIEEISTYIRTEMLLSKREYWRFRTCFYEILLNAIVHGNKYNTQKKVYIGFRIFGRILVVRVRDEGPGFNHHAINDPFDSENILKEFGRGITMVRSIADRIKFNLKGNEVTVFICVGDKN